MTTLTNPVGWFELYVADMARARAFYEAVFGRPLQTLPGTDSDDYEMLAFPWTEEASGAAGALVRSAHKGPGEGGTLIYFSCEDCATEAGRAEAAGGELVQAKMQIGEYGFIALVRDTEGNLIGLHSMA